MINILFIGGAGFIGSNLVHTFVRDKKYKIFVFEPLFSNLNRLENIKKSVIIIRGSIADYDLLKSIIADYKINIIVHLVSTLIPGSTYQDFKNEFENIVFPTIQLMEYCANKNVKFVYFSSGGTVYGNSTLGQKFKENDNLSPISYYGLTKQVIENNILFENRRGNLNYLIVRPSNPFGPGQSLHGNQGLIAVSIGKILAGDPLQVWGDGSSIRDYIFIDDLADALYQLVNSGVNNEIVNIGSGFGYSVNTVIERLKNFIDIPFKVEYKASRNVDVNSMVLDISKLQSLIPVRHTHLEDGIKRFYDYILTTLNK
jgi:UDP-glucose 4-epimerase